MKLVLTIALLLVLGSAITHKTLNKSVTKQAFSDDEGADHHWDLEELHHEAEMHLHRAQDLLIHKDQLQQETQQVFKGYDVDRNGKLSYEEFGKLLDDEADFNGQPRIHPMEKVHIVEMIDHNYDGQIDPQEAKSAFRHMLATQLVELARQVQQMRYELDLEHVSGNADGDNDEAELEKLDHKWWKIEQKVIDMQEAVANPQVLKDHILHEAMMKDYDMDGELNVEEFTALINEIQQYIDGEDAHHMSEQEVKEEIMPEVESKCDGKVSEKELMNAIRKFVYPSLVHTLVHLEQELVNIEMEENEYWNMDFPLDPWLEGYFVGWEECMYDGEYEYYEESSYYWDGESESEEFSSYDGEDYGETPL